MNGEAAMLVRVTDAAEGEVALRAGAERLGLSDARGPLPIETVRAIVAAAAKCAVSAAPQVLGTGGTPLDAALALAGAGVQTLELSASTDAPALLAHVRERHPEISGAILCSAGDNEAIGKLGLFAERGFSIAILVRAGTGRLIEEPGIEGLSVFINAAQRRGLQAWIGGALEPPDVPRLLALGVDVLAFRASVSMEGRRDLPLDPARVSAMRDMIPRRQARTGATARPAARDDARAADKVFVRDFIVEAGIGAYRYEHRGPQRMRFNVEADLAPIPDTVADMRDVFSYDVIVDAIRLATRLHAILVERVALDVADATLRDGRVRRVRVRVEKLDIIDGAIGVEIERSASRI